MKGKIKMTDDGHKKEKQKISQEKLDALKICNQSFFGTDSDSFFTRKPSQSSAKHGGKEEFEELAVLRGYFPCAFVLDENGEITGDGIYKNKDFLRLRDIILNLAAPTIGKVVLDIGCGKGAMMIYAGLQGAEVYGQDLSEDEVKSANKGLSHFNLKGEAKCGDIIDLQFPDNYFDIAISSDFYEHITDEVKTQSFREILRVLKPGGKLVIKTPNLSYLKISLLYKRLVALTRLENPLKLSIVGTNLPEECHGHLGLTTRKKFSQCLVNAGFQNYNFFYAPLRRFDFNYLIEILSTEIPVIRDLLCEDLIVRAFKPIALSRFPD